jgi:hypothetical protein
MGIGLLSLAGVPPLVGFVSKELVLAQAEHGVQDGVGVAGTIVKSGYTVTYTPGAAIAGAPASCNAGAPVASYFLAAAPVSPGTSGVRYFGTSEAQTIFQDSVAITAISAAGVPTPASAVPIK